MPKYKVLEKSFIENKLVEAGEIVEFEGEAGDNLELIDDAPKKRRAASEDEAA